MPKIRPLVYSIVGQQDSLRCMNILFDLDGTLSNPRDGIVRSFEYAVKALGYQCPSLSRLEEFIGPPLREAFRCLLGDVASGLIEEAVGKFRERYSAHGMFENQVYEGIPDVLITLRRKSYRLWVATTKPGVYAERILEHFGLNEYFDGVYGAQLDGGRSEKNELIELLLEREQIGARDAVMVGDRAQDIVGAKSNGVDGMGVLWGFGSREELEGARACVVVENVPALEALFCCPTSDWGGIV